MKKNPDLGILDYEVTDRSGKTVYDPNGFVVAGATGKLLVHVPDARFPSVITGEPGVRFRSDDATLNLTVEELARLARRALTPEEFHAIVKANGGVFHDVHDDFYDPETGEAFQPV